MQQIAFLCAGAQSIPLSLVCGRSQPAPAMLRRHALWLDDEFDAVATKSRMPKRAKVTRATAGCSSRALCFSQTRGRLCSAKPLAQGSSPQAPGHIRRSQNWSCFESQPSLLSDSLNCVEAKLRTPEAIDMMVKAPPTMAKTEVTKSYHLRSLLEMTTSTGDKS